MELTAHLITASGFSYSKFLACGTGRGGYLSTFKQLQLRFALYLLTGISRSSKPLKFIGKRLTIKPWPMTAFSEQLKIERFTEIILIK